MADIFHTFIIKASPTEVFNGFTNPKILDQWWTKKSKGIPEKRTLYELDFGGGYQWEAIVTKSKENSVFELLMTKSNEEWTKTKIGIELFESKKHTVVKFYHKGWRGKSDNFKFSSYCWAMYLRILKRYIEFGEKVPYSKRLSV